MIAATLLTLWFAQAPYGLPNNAPVFTPSLQEWNLGGAFVLKREKFLMWGPAFDPWRGWAVELRPMVRLELAPAHPKLAPFSLAFESMPANGAGYGLVVPKVQYKLPGTKLQIGMAMPVLAAFTADMGKGSRLLRPMAFVSGRF